MLYHPFPLRLGFELVPRRPHGHPPDGVRKIRRLRTPIPPPAWSGEFR